MSAVDIRLEAVRPGQRVAIVGAGMIGLSTAWFLQEHGIDVTLVERSYVGAGSSWGNAGWLTPGLTVPLPDPSVLRYGARAVLSASSPVYVPPQRPGALVPFLAGFARHCTWRRWEAGMRSLAPLNAGALDAFDELADGGSVPAPAPASPFLASFRKEKDAQHLISELKLLGGTGRPVRFAVLDGRQARMQAPNLSAEITTAVSIAGQRYLHPPDFISSLAAAVVQRGGKIVESTEVGALLDREDGRGVSVVHEDGVRERYDAVVLANGAWLGKLARSVGVRRLVQAGRGYSLSVSGATLPSGPLYFPTQRIACTPLDSPDGRRLRVAGMMEFRPPDAPRDQRRIDAIVAAARPLLDGVDLDERRDEWVGSRPCTTDGLPLVGETRSPRVFVAGGHGMWGIALGPVTGKLLAEQMVTGETPPALRALSPLR